MAQKVNLITNFTFKNIFYLFSFHKNFSNFLDKDGHAKEKILPIQSIGYGLGSIFLGILTFWIKDSKSLILVILILYVVLLLPGFLIKETPKWLYKKNRVNSLYSNLKSLAKFNNVGGFNFGEPNESKIKKKLGLFSFKLDQNHYEIKKRKQIGDKNPFFVFLENLWSIFVYPYGITTFVFIMVGFSLGSLFYSCIISVSDLGLRKVQYNQILLGVSQIVGSIAGYVILPKVPKKKATQIFLSIFVAISFVLWLLSYFKKSPGLMTIETIVSTLGIFSGVAVMFCIFNTYIIQTYPVEYRGLAFGIIVLGGKILCTWTKYMIDVSLDLGLSPLVIPCLPSLVAIPFTFLLKEVRPGKEKQEGYIEFVNNEIVEF